MTMKIQRDGKLLKLLIRLKQSGLEDSYMQVMFIEKEMKDLKEGLMIYNYFFYKFHYLEHKLYYSLKVIFFQHIINWDSIKRFLTVYLAEEANVDELLDDEFRTPSYEWGETFCTLMGNKIRIYTNSQFDVVNPTLTYYRKPRYIQITNVVDPYTGLVSAADVTCEFKDDIVELLIDETASIIAGDIESANQFARGTQNAERNN